MHNKRSVLHNSTVRTQVEVDVEQVFMAPTIPTIVRCGHYEIQVLSTGLLPFETHAFAFKFSIVVTWTIWAFYVAFQVLLLSRIQHAPLEIYQWQLWTALISKILLDFPFVVLSFSIALDLFSVLDAISRPNYILQEDSASNVDVMITCYDVSISVVNNTIAAVVNQNYSFDRLRVYILDDENNDDLRKFVEELNRDLNRTATTTDASIVYLSRKLSPEEFSHFKSGNLRYDIQQSRDRFDNNGNANTKARIGSQFLAALDADMISKREWLRKMISHLLLDDNLSLACPPQTYYNIPQTNALDQQIDFDIYFIVQEVVNDRLDVVMCIGSGYIARRSAIESIGD